MPQAVKHVNSRDIQNRTLPKKGYIQGSGRIDWGEDLINPQATSDSIGSLINSSDATWGG